MSLRMHFFSFKFVFHCLLMQFIYLKTNLKITIAYLLSLSLILLIFFAFNEHISLIGTVYKFSFALISFPALFKFAIDVLMSMEQNF